MAASSSDLASIASLTVQIDSLSKQLAVIPPGPAHDMIQAQVSMLSAQLTATASHAQQQAEASANMLDSLGLFATLGNLIGNQAPTIINLFKR